MKKSSDLSVMLNGMGIVAKTLVELQKNELFKIWNNSSLNSLSKSTINSCEEKLSTAFSNPDKIKAITNIAKETKERVSIVAESLQCYSAYIAKRKYVSSENQVQPDLEHPIINDDIIANVSIETPKYEGQIDVPEYPNSNSQINATPEIYKSNHIEVKQSLYTPEINQDAGVLTPEHSKSAQSKSKSFKIQELQKLSDRAKERKVPSSQIGRILSYGGLAAGMGMGAAVEVAKRRLGIKSTNEISSSLLSENPMLSESNVNRIVDTLCKVRGAALKLGQMLSLQDNAMIDPKLASIFERVRQSADFMPYWQMKRVLNNELGPDWQSKFASFDPKPFAAASIGQVHSGKLIDGASVAIKIQYPGVAQSIKSDIKSLMSIVSFWNILPKGLYVDNVMAVAERELKREVDYINEAESGKIFKELLKPYPEFYVPHVYKELSTQNILITELVYGDPVDKLLNADQNTRNMVCERLLKLCLSEIFLFRFMQTDPNWSNFFYNYNTEQIVLLDFGACKKYTVDFVDTYMKIIKASADRDRESILKFSQQLGFLTGYETKVMEEAHVDAVMILGEAFACETPFDFRRQNMTQRIHDLVPIMLKHRLTPPPEETYTLHRKMSGIFLLCTKLGATIDCRKLFDDIYLSYVKQKDTA